jgi:hypothetical protein
VAAELASAIAAVEAGLAALTPDMEADIFPAPVGTLRPRTGLLLTHLAVHLAFHLGQAGYLRRALTGDATSAGGMSIPELLGH